MRERNSYSTIGALAAVAFVFACVAHEVIGHGGMCLALGGRITLVTSVYFRSTNGGPLVDAAGPLMNLVAGAACWTLARNRPPSSSSRVFLLLAMAFNLFWGSGYLIYSAVSNQGDWAFVLRDLALEPRWFWRLLIGIAGGALYVCFARAVHAQWPRGVPLVWPYLVAGAVSCAAALCFAGPVLPAVRAAAQESFASSAGLLFVAYRRARQSASSLPSEVVLRSNGWLIISALVTTLFLLVLGRGCGAAGQV